MCSGVVSHLSKNCPKGVLKLFQGCPRVVLLLCKLSYSFPIVFLSFVQLSVHWPSCPEVDRYKGSFNVCLRLSSISKVLLEFGGWLAAPTHPSPTML